MLLAGGTAKSTSTQSSAFVRKTPSGQVWDPDVPIAGIERCNQDYTREGKP